MDIYAKVKYNEPSELFAAVNGAFSQPTVKEAMFGDASGNNKPKSMLEMMPAGKGAQTA